MTTTPIPEAAVEAALLAYYDEGDLPARPVRCRTMAGSRNALLHELAKEPK